MDMIKRRPLALLIALLSLKAIVVGLWMSATHLGLAPDEAQYWTWSRALDIGYYSKPPGIAWQIWLSTFLFGDSVIGIRIGTLCLSFLISLSVYGLARKSGLRCQTAFLAAALSALTPLGLFASYYATTDIGLVLFWTLSCLVVASALHDERAPSFWLLGVLIALGALYKWPIYLIWIPVAATAVFVPSFRSLKMVGGFAVSLIGLAPSFIWNFQRSWPTFRHVWSTVAAGETAAKGNFWDFFGAQAALLSPLFFLLLLYAFVFFARHFKRVPLPIKFCGLTTGGVLLTYQTLAYFQKMQGNWCVFIYPTAIVFLAWTLMEGMEKGKKWLLPGFAVSFVLVALIMIVPGAQLIGLGPKIPLRVNRFQECLGWERLGPLVSKLGYDPKRHCLAGHTYQMSALLSFYGEGKKRAYFLNLEGRRHNQFSFWPGMKKGTSVFFVSVEKTPFHLEEAKRRFAKDLAPYFERVDFAGAEPILEIYGEPAKVALVFSCTCYLGGALSDGAGW